MTAPAAAYTPIQLFAATLEQPHGRRLELATHRDRSGTSFLTIKLRDGGGRVAIPLSATVLQELITLLGRDLFDGTLLP